MILAFVVNMSAIPRDIIDNIAEMTGIQYFYGVDRDFNTRARKEIDRAKSVIATGVFEWMLSKTRDMSDVEYPTLRMYLRYYPLKYRQSVVDGIVEVYGDRVANTPHTFESLIKYVWENDPVYLHIIGW